MLRCPDPCCRAAVGQDMINLLAPDEDKEKYSRYLLRSYVEGNRKVCPQYGTSKSCYCIWCNSLFPVSVKSGYGHPFFHQILAHKFGDNYNLCFLVICTIYSAILVLKVAIFSFPPSLVPSYCYNLLYSVVSVQSFGLFG
jgi:hypothetical protein